MIYVLFGNDTAKSREKLNSLINSLLTKKPDAMLIRSDATTFTESFVGDYAQSQGLFEQKSIIVFDTVFENKNYKEFLLKNLKELSTSENVFIFLEGKLDSKAKEKFEKHAEKIQEFGVEKKVEKKHGFNIFELSDALGARDKKSLWVIYQTGKLNNISDEEMHGILFWGVKNMLLSTNTKTATEAGLSPFVYKKSLAYSKNYSEDELGKLSSNLVNSYHRARRGQIPFDVALESLILELK